MQIGSCNYDNPHSQLCSTSKLVDMYRDQIDTNLARTPMIGLPPIQRELSLRRCCSSVKTCSSIGSVESDKNDEDEAICRPSIDQETSQSLPSSGRPREWIPSAASGMI